MRYSFIKLFLVFLLSFYAINAFGQNVTIKIKSEKIIIKKDSSFVKNVSVLLKKSDEPVIYPIFYDNDLEKISDIQVFIKKGKRFKPLKDHSIVEEDVILDYISSKKVKYIIIPTETEAKITYSIKCNELMYFSNLRFFSNYEMDTLKYQITIPNSFQFVHNTIYKDSLDYFVIDSIRSDSITRWKIDVKPVKTEPDPLMFFGVYKNIKMPLMRTLIIPASYENNERKFMNDWYLDKVASRRGLSPIAIQKIHELTKGISDPMEITDILYNYVRNNFKYVAIEIGMGAFVPTHVNEVFTNKQGDCKDLSNFLSEALNYKGIKSYIALAATYDHISDCDFPSLSSANHVICLAYINDEPILLDPTDPIHFPQTPIQSIQERSILIINPNGGEFYKVAGFSPQQNLISYDIELKANSHPLSMEGNFKAQYEGISGNFLRREFMYVGKDKMNSYILKHYESLFSNQTISDVSINNDEKTVGAEGKISVNGKIFEDAGNRLLFIDFLPRIIETENRETLLEGTHLGSPFNKKVNLSITMDESFESFAPIEHTFTNKGVSLSLKITSPSDLVVECKYEFIFDYIIIEKENVNLTNDILKSFKKITDEPIILKKKS